MPWLIRNEALPNYAHRKPFPHRFDAPHANCLLLRSSGCCNAIRYFREKPRQNWKCPFRKKGWGNSFIPSQIAMSVSEILFPPLRYLVLYCSLDIHPLRDFTHLDVKECDTLLEETLPFQGERAPSAITEQFWRTNREISPNYLFITSLTLLPKRLTFPFLSVKVALF